MAKKNPIKNLYKNIDRMAYKASKSKIKIGG
jgi:hypothetical protein